MKHPCIYYLFAALLLLSFSACSTTGSTIQPHAVNSKIDTISVVRDRIDSVYLHDSIFVAVHGDTIIKEKYHTKYKLKYVYRDSIHVRLDSIPYPVEVIKEVRYTPKTVKALAGVGGIFLLTLFLWIGIRIYTAFRP